MEPNLLPVNPSTSEQLNFINFHSVRGLFEFSACVGCSNGRRSLTSLTLKLNFYGSLVGQVAGERVFDLDGWGGGGYGPTALLEASFFPTIRCLNTVRGCGD